MPGLINGGDLGMAQASQGLRFVMEHPRVDLVDGVSAPHHLECDTTLRRMLFGLVDDPHPALAEYTEDAVTADRFDRFNRQNRWRLNGVAYGYGGFVLCVFVGARSFDPAPV
jgi:hypothetical protein